MDDTLKPIVCRVCLEFDTDNSKKFLSIFESFEDCLLSDRINSIANVGIREYDGLPDRLCPDCVIHLESAIAFKNKCEASNAILLNTEHNPLSKKPIEVPVKEEVELDYDYLVETYEDRDDADTEEIKTENDTTENRVKTYTKSKEPVQCDDCGGEFKSKCKLRMHWKKDHKPEKLTCCRCKRMFMSYKAFNHHNRKKTLACIAASKARIEGVGRNRTFHCLHCEYKTRRPKDIDTHSVTHIGERRYKCEKCPKRFTQTSSLQAHKESCHKDYLIETTCQFCGKLIKGRNKLYRHLRRHTEQRVKCDVCMKSLKNRRYLVEHMKRHSGVKSHSCDKCVATFYTLAEVYNHKTRVHTQKTNKCDICGYSTKTVSGIKAHKAKHSATNVVCLICGAFVENSKLLVLHQKRHFEKNYPCPLCVKSFHTSKSRSSHVRSKHNCTVLKAKEKPVAVKQECQGVRQYDKVMSLSPENPA